MEETTSCRKNKKERQKAYVTSFQITDLLSTFLCGANHYITCSERRLMIDTQMINVVL